MFQNQEALTVESGIDLKTLCKKGHSCLFCQGGEHQNNVCFGYSISLCCVDLAGPPAAPRIALCVPFATGSLLFLTSSSINNVQQNIHIDFSSRKLFNYSRVR